MGLAIYCDYRAMQGNAFLSPTAPIIRNPAAIIEPILLFILLPLSRGLISRRFFTVTAALALLAGLVESAYFLIAWGADSIIIIEEAFMLSAISAAILFGARFNITLRDD